MSLRSFSFLTGCLGWAALTGRAAEREFTRTFPVQPGCTVKLDSYRGRIVVVEHDQAEVQVTLQMETRSDDAEEAARVFGAVQIDATEAANTVTLRARNPRETRVRFVWNDKHQIDLAWRITVPRRCTVDLATRSGAITVGSLTGRVVARTETGTIFLKRIDGSIDASTEVGDVVISRCSGPAKVRVLRGTIRAGTMGGFADLQNATGDVEVLAARGGITASAEAGDVRVGFPRGTTGGAKLTTSGGSIHAKIDPAANCRVNASSVWGRVESRLPMTVVAGANGKSNLAGRLGEGGPAFTFHANGGHVKLTTGENFIEEAPPDPAGEPQGASDLRSGRK